MPHSPGRKLLLVGWDAADWQVIHPLLDAGLMPTLQRLVEGGVIGNLATLQPMLSPMLWTSIATGKRASAHGILGFVEPSPDGTGVRPVQCTSRTAKALWNILSQSGRRTHAIGWYASHPAEPIHGVCVSNQFAFAPADSTPETWPVPNGSIHPAGLVESLTALRVHPREIPANMLQMLIPRAAELDQSNPNVQRLLTMLAQRLAECITVHAAATAVMENEPWDFCAITYECIDQVGHDFMTFHPPRLPWVEEQAFEVFCGVMSGIYRFHDLMLERLLQLAGEDSHVMIVSDHGFLNDHRRPPGKVEPAQWHRSQGVFCLYGPGIKADETIHGATLLDIAPTVLTLFGLPVGADMEGKILVNAFEQPPEIQRIESWETVPGDAGLHPASVASDPALAATAMQHLAELGYLEAIPLDAQAAMAMAHAEQQFNLAALYLEAKRPSEAVSILEGLVERHPTTTRYLEWLIQAYFTAQNFEGAQRSLDALVKIDPVHPKIDFIRGLLAWADGKMELSLAAFHRAAGREPNDAWLQCRIGLVFLRQRRWAEAEAVFQRALAIDPDSAEAHYGLSVAIPRQDRPEEGIDHALRAVGLRHDYPEAHFQLGAVLSRLGWFDRAAQAFEISLALRPGMVFAHRYLSRIYHRMGRTESARNHREIADQLIARNAPQPRVD